MIAPQRHLSLLNKIPQPNPCQKVGASTSRGSSRKSIGDRLLALVNEIEAFLKVCTYEEMCNFWAAVTDLRHRLHKSPYVSEVPQFLNGRRQTRDFCRILEVLADLPYPQMHLSNQGDRAAAARRQAANCEAQIYFAMQR
ncbi:MAG: hypothetical protein AUK48_04535 [Oscillatoriales cyanobacterium CG2_30_44_21]|nr:MAG: hypothetical protein AUK48_04535 [Oscillatoriales cyanobacterium CG2_30_44_21]